MQREIGIVQDVLGKHAAAVETCQRVRKWTPDLRSYRLPGQGTDTRRRVEEALSLWQPGAIWPINAYARLANAPSRQTRGEHGRYPYRMVIIRDRMGDMPRAIEALNRRYERAASRTGPCCSSLRWRRFVIIRGRCDP